MLAAIDLNLIYVIAAAAYGVFALWNDLRQKKAAAEEEARQAEGRSQSTPNRVEKTPAPAATSEEERMRKFLEALGVPSPTQTPPLRPPQSQPPAPKPISPPPPKPASPTMAPRPVAMPIPRPMMPRPAAPKPVPLPPVIAREAPVFTEARRPVEVEAEGPGAVGDHLSTAFSQMHAEQAADVGLPSIVTAASGNAPTTGVAARFVSAQGYALRELLRSRESLRAAIVVSEVLGPPKGL